MNRSDFSSHARSHFQTVTDSALSDLRAGEEAIFGLEAENTLFVRFNGNRVRQNTDVEQLSIFVKFLSGGRTVEKSRSLTGNAETDRAAVSRMLQSCREEARVLPADPHQVDVANNGTSSEEFKGCLLNPEELIETITATAEGSDLAGLYCGGPVVRASRNSKGQDHWFATETFFMDYSLYNGPKASKAVYAGSEWSRESWLTNLSQARLQLAQLEKPIQDVKPGKYRTYLAPGAVSELLSMLSWGAVSAASWKQGRCAFRKLADGEAKLSPLFTLRENFTLGLAPRFNSEGEVAPESITLFESGEMREMLVSSKTAKEYGLKGNAAESWEMLRSPELTAGSLDEKDTLRELGTGLYLSNLHYLNWSDVMAARVTGMTRYACFWVENGEIVGPIKDLRFDESLYEALGPKLLALTSHAEIDPSVSTYGGRSLGGRCTPGLLIDGFTFTL